MKTLKNVLMVLLLCGAAAIFTGCEELSGYLNGVTVTVINNTSEELKITYVDFYEDNRPDDSDSYNKVKIRVSGKSTTFLNVQPGTDVIVAEVNSSAKETYHIYSSDKTITINNDTL